MTIQKRTVAVLIPNYNGKHFLEDCLTSLAKDVYSHLDPIIYIIDNASTDGSREYLASYWPSVKVLRLETNLGYAGGLNRGYEQALTDYPDIEFVILLNSDTVVESGFLEPLVSQMDTDMTCGAAQPLLVLHAHPDRVNSLGNVIHFLGFGYTSHCDELIHTFDLTSYDHTIINYASGAAALLRVKAIKETGLFEDFMFMYLEDLDLGWRLSAAGWKSLLVTESIVYHKYEFHRGMKLYYYFERNRLWVLLKNYQISTLLAIAPAWCIMEVGQLLYAIKEGRLREKLKAYGFFFSRDHLHALLLGRSHMQQIRKRSDGSLLRSFSGAILFQPIENGILRVFVNPFFSFYLSILTNVIP